MPYGRSVTLSLRSAQMASIRASGTPTIHWFEQADEAVAEWVGDSSIVTLDSGMPANIISGGDANENGYTSSNRPNVVREPAHF